jgi:plastocyanin
MKLSKLSIAMTMAAAVIAAPAAFADKQGCKSKNYGSMPPAHPYYGKPYHPPYYGQPRSYQNPYGYQRPTNPSYGYAPYGYTQPEKPKAGDQAKQKSPVTSDANAVNIQGMRFGSGSITIKAGESVTWTNSERMPHTVTANDGSFSSSALNAGDTFTQKFDKPGKYTYYCQYHPMMKAEIIVTEA